MVPDPFPYNGMKEAGAYAKRKRNIGVSIIFIFYVLSTAVSLRNPWDAANFQVVVVKRFECIF